MLNPSSSCTSLLTMMLCWFPFLLGNVAGRDTVSFNFGWKHRTGLHDWADPNELPPTDTNPGLRPPEASINYNTTSWRNVQLPHDGLIATSPSETACPDGCSGRSYIPRHLLWYRKMFSLPEDWQHSVIWLEFDGAFRNTTVWINGELVANHECGYTPFLVRLDNLTVTYGSSAEKNSIAVFVDPDNGDFGGPAKGSGWWYEGGGLYRDVRLIRADRVHVEHDSLYARSDITFDKHGEAREALLHLEASATNNGPQLDEICATFLIMDAEGTEVTSSAIPTQELLLPGESMPISQSIRILFPRLWTSSNPYMYDVVVILEDCGTGEELDSVSTSHGFRSLDFDANRGFFMNKENWKIRGFCDHSTFGVVGMAVPDRINLFRAQASRSVGGNGRRTSHNPPDPTLLDIYDRLGMVVIDENRLFGDNARYVDNMGVLVKRDRNHPSVIIWSFCNEGNCEGDNETGGPAFQAITQKFDSTRPTLANMFTFNDLLSNTIDIQGFSHKNRKKLDDCHAAMPEKPIFMSECCSCNTMRSEDVGCETKGDNPHYECTQIAFNARCLDSMVNASDGVGYAIGTMVWTLFDYYGEPPKPGFEISSTYGQFDLVGFPKHAAFWFRTQWLLGISDERSDKTFPTSEVYEVQIVESWESPDTWNETKGNSTRTIHAYSNAPFIELFVNEESQGSLPVYPMVQGGGSYAEFNNVTWKPGTLKAVAHSTNHTELASTVRRTSGKATRLTLNLDCPSKATGTGEALLLDGQDVALVRASVVDDSGQVVHMATNNITFSVLSGPGLLLGTGNGDAKSYEPNNAAWHSAYHGLVRAVVRVTSTAALSEQEQMLLQLIDSGGEGLSYEQILDDRDIVIEARSIGFDSVRLTIPTSTDASKASVLSVAKASAGKVVNFFGDSTKSETGSISTSFSSSAS